MDPALFEDNVQPDNPLRDMWRLRGSRHKPLRLWSIPKQVSRRPAHRHLANLKFNSGGLHDFRKFDDLGASFRKRGGT